jgi:hypothetical protein
MKARQAAKGPTGAPAKIEFGSGFVEFGCGIIKAADGFKLRLWRFQKLVGVSFRASAMETTHQGDCEVRSRMVEAKVRIAIGVRVGFFPMEPRASWRNLAAAVGQSLKRATAA